MHLFYIIAVSFLFITFLLAITHGLLTRNVRIRLKQWAIGFACAPVAILCYSANQFCLSKPTNSWDTALVIGLPVVLFTIIGIAAFAVATIMPLKAVVGPHQDMDQ
jgi:NhaP-type Na+/H+ or K+/H+ antiporter